MRPASVRKPERAKPALPHSRRGTTGYAGAAAQKSRLRGGQPLTSAMTTFPCTTAVAMRLGPTLETDSGP